MSIEENKIHHTWQNLLLFPLTHLGCVLNPKIVNIFFGFHCAYSSSSIVGLLSIYWHGSFNWTEHFALELALRTFFTCLFAFLRAANNKIKSPKHNTTQTNRSRPRPHNTNCCVRTQCNAMLQRKEQCCRFVFHVKKIDTRTVASFQKIVGGICHNFDNFTCDFFCGCGAQFKFDWDWNFC